MEAITGKDMRGDRILPFWLEQGIESSLRDTEEDTPIVSFTAMPSAPAQRSIGPSQVASSVVLTPAEGTSLGTPGIRDGGGKGPFTDLDKFYADEEDEDGDEDEATDEEDETSDSEEECGSEGQPCEREGGEEVDEDDGSDSETEDSDGNPRQHA